jgi:hypothetical protein
VRIIIAAIISYTVGKEVGNCGKMIGTNIREEAQRRINLAKNDYDINHNYLMIFHTVSRLSYHQAVYRL